MCGRYALHSNPDVIALQFGLESVPPFEVRYNVCPGGPILIVREDKARRRRADLYRWGLIPGWAKDAAIGNRLVNARAETITEKPAFRSAFRAWRCLVPASGYYEWKTVAGRKYPYYVQPKDEPLFALAGLTEAWKGPDGVVRSVSLITTPPNALLAGIHDRMPVIVPPERYAEWLDPQNRDPQRLKGFLSPYAEERMEARPVSPAVSNPRNEGRQLIEPLAEALSR